MTRCSRLPLPNVALLEPRSYLSGVAFSPAINTDAAGARISPVTVDLAQVYGGGTADLVVANSNNSVAILRGNGDGTFGPAVTVPLDFAPQSIEAGILASNGQMDLVVGSDTGDVFGVILQTSAGQFSEQDYVTGMANAQSLTIGDFNGDGKLDIAVASDDGGNSNNVAIFANDGTGRFALSQLVSVPHARVSSITTFTAGSATDLAVANSTDNQVTTLLNNGAGSFRIGSDYTVGSDPVSITDGQFNTNFDHYDDLVTADSGGRTVSVLRGNDDGTFTSAVSTTVDGAAQGGGPVSVRIAGLRSIFNTDLVCLLSPGSSGDAEALLSNGDGTYQSGGIIATRGATRTGIAAGDLNDDGLTDVVLADRTQVTSLVNVTNENPSRPSAVISSTQPSVAPGAGAIQFTVTYTDATQINVNSIGDGNLTVSTPGGATAPATLVSTDLFPSQRITVTYSIPAASGSASAADDGTYTVTANRNSVTNIGGIALAAGPIGQFTVNVPAQNGPNLVAAAVTANNPAAAVGGTRFAGATRVTITNSGNQTAKGKIAIDLYASPTASVPAGTPAVSTVVRAINLRPGAKVNEVLPGFVWPATPGAYFIVADVDASKIIAETNFADNVGMSAKSTLVAAPYVDIANLWSGRLPRISDTNRRPRLAVVLTNVGNSIARAGANFTIAALYPQDNPTIVGTGSIRIAMRPGGRQVINLPLAIPNTLARGTYRLSVTISYPADSDAANDTVTSESGFTVQSLRPGRFPGCPF